MDASAGNSASVNCAISSCAPLCACHSPRNRPIDSAIAGSPMTSSLSLTPSSGKAHSSWTWHPSATGSRCKPPAKRHRGHGRAPPHDRVRSDACVRCGHSSLFSWRPTVGVEGLHSGIVDGACVEGQTVDPSARYNHLAPHHAGRSWHSTTCRPPASAARFPRPGSRGRCRPALARDASGARARPSGSRRRGCRTPAARSAAVWR